MIDLRQSKEYGRYMELLGWVVEKIGKNYISIRKIPLTPFSVIKAQRPKMLIPFKKIDGLAKKYRALVVYFEPNLEPQITNQELRMYGYKRSKTPFLPTRTIHLGLVQSEEKILAQMKKDTRYSLRKTTELDIKTLRYKDIKEFHQAWRKSASWRRHVPSLNALQALKKSFGKNAVFLATTCHPPNTKLLAGTITLIANQSAYYYYAFTSKKGREKLAQYLLVWKAIRLAKNQGCKIFDFEGIYDPRFPQKSWKGFSHFKKSFGGKEVEYPGCFRKFYKPFR